jgi:hypothetical protein
MDKLTGYGPSDPAGKGLPLFDGRQDRFADFKFKATALFLEHELDAIVECSSIEEWRRKYDALRAIKDTPFEAYGNMEGAEEYKKKQEDASQRIAHIEKKNRTMAFLLISRLSPSVSDQLRKCVPERLQFNAAEIFFWMVNTYGTSKRAVRAANNVERNIINVINLSWSGKGQFSEHLQQVKQRLSGILLDEKFNATLSAQKMLHSLVLRALVDRISGDHRYGAIHTKYITTLVDADKFVVDADMFKQFCEEVEIADQLLHHSYTSQAVNWQRRTATSS